MRMGGERVEEVGPDVRESPEAGTKTATPRDSFHLARLVMRTL
jgi:hypothetical protein